MPNPEASYDSLFVIRELQQPLNGTTSAEVHVLTYLACLLALYRGRPVAEWGYSFVKTKWDTPYSHDITTSLDDLLRCGYIAPDSDGMVNTLVCTPRGHSIYQTLDGLKTNRSRRDFLRPACGSSLALSISQIRLALSLEPTLRSAQAHTGAIPLLSAPALGLLYKEFKTLRLALGTIEQNLLLPSCIWMSLLAEKQRSERQ